MNHSIFNIPHSIFLHPLLPRTCCGRGFLAGGAELFELGDYFFDILGALETVIIFFPDDEGGEGVADALNRLHRLDRREVEVVVECIDTELGELFAEFGKHIPFTHAIFTIASIGIKVNDRDWLNATFFFDLRDKEIVFDLEE